MFFDKSDTYIAFTIVRRNLAYIFQQPSLVSTY